MPTTARARPSVDPSACIARTASRLPGALRTFSEYLAGDLVLEHRLGQQPLQPGVLRFQRLQELGIRDVHATELAAPKVVASLGEPVLAAQTLDRHAGINLLQEPDDLRFAESLLHVQSPR